MAGQWSSSMDHNTDTRDRRTKCRHTICSCRHDAVGDRVSSCDNAAGEEAPDGTRRHEEEADAQLPVGLSLEGATHDLRRTLDPTCREHPAPDVWPRPDAASSNATVRPVATACFRLLAETSHRREDCRSEDGRLQAPQKPPTSRSRQSGRQSSSPCATKSTPLSAARPSIFQRTS